MGATPIRIDRAREVLAFEPPDLELLRARGGGRVRVTQTDGLFTRDTERVFYSEGQRVISWIEHHCIFTEGAWAGQPFRLLGWQKRLIIELFEVEWRRLRGEWRWLRRFRRALIGLARKSGKSELAAALALYLAFGDEEPTAKVYCAAASEDQADIVYSKAKAMCVMEEDAPLHDDVLAEVRRLSLRADPYSYVERLSSKGRTKHGLNPHGVVFDEFHAWLKGQNSELYDALTTGSGTRDQPMQIAITTAGTDLEESRCGELYRMGRRIERKELDGKGFLFRWWQAPRTQCQACKEYLFDADDKCPTHPEMDPKVLDYRDPAMWKLSSPSYGETVSDSFYEDELATTSEGPFRRLYLNQWVEYETIPWLPPGAWAACLLPMLQANPLSWPAKADATGWPMGLPTGQDTIAGVDLSESRDSTAVAWGQKWSGDERPCGHTTATHGDFCLAVRVRLWEPPLDEEGRVPEGYQIPQAEVKEHVREIASEFSMLSSVWDPWHSKLMRQDLENEGLPVEEIWQTGARRIGATAALYDLIMQGRLHHDGDSALARHMANAGTKASGEGYYLSKRKTGRPMDGAMSLVNVVYGVQWAKKKEKPGVVAWFPSAKKEDEE